MRRYKSLADRVKAASSDDKLREIFSCTSYFDYTDRIDGAKALLEIGRADLANELCLNELYLIENIDKFTAGEIELLDDLFEKVQPDTCERCDRDEEKYHWAEKLILEQGTSLAFENYREQTGRFDNQSPYLLLANARHNRPLSEHIHHVYDLHRVDISSGVDLVSLAALDSSLVNDPQCLYNLIKFGDMVDLIDRLPTRAIINIVHSMGLAKFNELMSESIDKAIQKGRKIQWNIALSALLYNGTHIDMRCSEVRIDNSKIVQILSDEDAARHMELHS